MRLMAVTICFVISALLGSTSLSFADDLYLEIDGILGESVDDQHLDWIDLQSYEWQVSNTTSPLNQTQTGEAIIRPLVVTKHVDKASPLLALSVLKGTLISKVVLESVMEGGDRHTRVKITMEGVLVSNIAFGSDSGERALESLAFRFNRICYRYTLIDSVGTPGVSVEKCWDVAANDELEPVEP